MAAIIGAKATQRSAVATKLRRRIATVMTAAAMGRLLAAAAAGAAHRRSTPGASPADVKS